MQLYLRSPEPEWSIGLSVRPGLTNRPSPTYMKSLAAAEEHVMVQLHFLTVGIVVSKQRLLSIPEMRPDKVGVVPNLEGHHFAICRHRYSLRILSSTLELEDCQARDPPPSHLEVCTKAPIAKVAPLQQH